MPLISPLLRRCMKSAASFLRVLYDSTPGSFASASAFRFYFSPPGEALHRARRQRCSALAACSMSSVAAVRRIDGERPRSASQQPVACLAFYAQKQGARAGLRRSR